MSDALHDVESGPVFTHEIAYVMGQLQHPGPQLLRYPLSLIPPPAAIATLQRALKNPVLNPMVRHEAAEALGSIADVEVRSNLAALRFLLIAACPSSFPPSPPQTIKLLEEFSHDSVEPVKESCVVALDILAYENSNEFQYADGVETVSS